MQPRVWQLGACALFGCFACACTTSGSVPAVDASTPVADANVPPVSDDSGAVDSSLPVSLDSAAAPDSAEAAAADSAPSSDTDADAGAACTWDGSYESPSCSSCLRTICCPITAACEGDPACVALDTCVDACLTTNGGDAGSVADCSQTCFDAQSVMARDEWTALNNCIEYSCNDAGSGPCQ